jgi:hypothetical protein
MEAGVLHLQELVVVVVVGEAAVHVEVQGEL